MLFHGADVNLNSLILDDPKWTVGISSLLLVQGLIKVPLLQESVLKLIKFSVPLLEQN